MNKKLLAVAAVVLVGLAASQSFAAVNKKQRAHFFSNKFGSQELVQKFQQRLTRGGPELSSQSLSVNSKKRSNMSSVFSASSSKKFQKNLEKFFQSRRHASSTRSR